MRKGAIVLCAANAYSGVKLADQHMAEALSRLRPVLYVDPPISFLNAAKNRRLATALDYFSPKPLSPSLSRLTPLVLPFPSRRGMIGITSSLLRTIVRRAARSLDCEVAAVVSAWPLHPVFGSCQERVKVYWAQDDFVGGAALLGWKAEQVDDLERKVAADANVIVAANPLVEERWRKLGSTTRLIPYGVNADAYSAVERSEWPADVKLPSPIAGFVGHINDRIDLALLEEIANRRRSLLLVGPRTRTSESKRWDALIARPNVAWVGQVPFANLPPYLRAIDVGLLPYGDSAFNRGSFPLKTLEYLAAGKPVVATNLPAIRWLDSKLVTTAASAAEFADATDAWLNRPSDAGEVQSRRSLAAQHTWIKRAEELLTVIETSALERRADYAVEKKSAAIAF